MIVGLFRTISVFVNFIVAAMVGVTVLFVFHFFTSPAIANMNFFFFLQTALAISIEGATFYFFTDEPLDLEKTDGPGFSIYFYTTGIGLVASVFNILGMIMYNKSMKFWR